MAAWQVGDAPRHPGQTSYDLKSMHRNQALLEDFRATLTQLGFVCSRSTMKTRRASTKSTTRHDDALAAADRYQLFKTGRARSAEHMGWCSRCMPKPLAGAPGSGLHFHLSLTDAQGRAVSAAPPRQAAPHSPAGKRRVGCQGRTGCRCQRSGHCCHAGPGVPMGCVLPPGCCTMPMR